MILLQAVTCGGCLQVLRVRSCMDGSHAAQVLKDGDLVLAVNGQPVTSYRHVEAIIASRPLPSPTHPTSPSKALHTLSLLSSPSFESKENVADSPDGTGTAPTPGSPRDAAAVMKDKTSWAEGNSPQKGPAGLIKAARPSEDAVAQSRTAVVGNDKAWPCVSLTIFRGSEVQEVGVQLGLEDGLGTRRLVHWCGAMLQVTAYQSQQLVQRCCLMPCCSVHALFPKQSPNAAYSAIKRPYGASAPHATCSLHVASACQACRTGAEHKTPYRCDSIFAYAAVSLSVDGVPGGAQAPHRPVREMGACPAQAGVYVSRWHHGSPAHRYSLYALNWITELNGIPVPDLDTFVKVAKSLPDKSFARLKLCQLEMNKTKVGTPTSVLHV